MRSESPLQCTSNALPNRLVLPVFCLLLTLHLPLVLPLIQLRTVDSFWLLTTLIPLLLVVLLRRIAAENAGLTKRCYGLIAADLVLLCTAAGLGSPWLAALALAILITAYLNQFRSVNRRRYPAGISLLPLLAAGLPPSVSMRCWPAYTEWIADTASWFSSILGVVHAREADSIVTVSGSVSIQQVCSGPFGLLLLLLHMVTLGLLRRRSFLHLLLCMLLVVPVAAMHAVGTMLMLLLFADTGGFWTAVVPISLLMLLPAALLEDSLEWLVAWFTLPIVGEDMVEAASSGEAEEDMRNWLRELWNRWVSGIEPQRSLPLRIWQENGEFIGVTRPLVNAVTEWRFSRSFQALKLGSVGFIFLLIISSLQYLNASGRESQIARLQSLLDLQAADGNSAVRDVAFRGLRYLQPGNVRAAFDYVEFLLEEDRADDATTIVTQLCSLGQNGVAEAHLWLVRRSLSGELVPALTIEQRKEHLDKANMTLGKSAEIQRLLADVYFELREYSLAHKYIVRFGELAPAKLLSRFAFELKINRFDREGAEFNSFLSALEQAQRANPDDNELTMQLFDAYILATRWNDGILLLQGNLAVSEDPGLQKRYGGALLLAIQAILYQGSYDGFRVQVLLNDIIHRAPDTPGLFETVIEAFRGGCRFESQTLSELYASVQAADAAANNLSAGPIKLAIVQLMTAVSEGEQFVVPDSLPLHPLSGEYLQLLKWTGNAAAAHLLAEQQLELLRNDSEWSVEQQIRYEVLLLTVLDRSGEAKMLLDDRGRSVLSAEKLQSIYNRVDNLAFDAVNKNTSSDPRMKKRLPEFSSESEAMAVIGGLRRSSGEVRARLGIADRLCRIIIAGGPGVSAAETLLTELQVSEQVPGDIAAHVGAVALDFDRFDLALKWLSRARLLSPRPNYVLLNNLAILGVRGPEANAESREGALGLIEQALTLQPDHPELLATRGEVLLSLNRPRMALRDLQSSFERDKLNPHTLRLLAEAQDQNGEDSTEVRELLRRITKGTLQDR